MILILRSRRFRAIVIMSAQEDKGKQKGNTDRHRAHLVSQGDTNGGKSGGRRGDADKLTQPLAVMTLGRLAIYFKHIRSYMTTLQIPFLASPFLPPTRVARHL